MANIHLNGSSNSHINFADPSMPKYIGARAVVTRSENGVVIWMKDYKGETTETIAEAIQSITTNANGSLTFILPDGREITTGSLTGPQGPQGVQGETGETGVGITSIEKTGTSGLVDTYTITFDDETTETFTVTNGAKGDKGDTGNTGSTGPQGESGSDGFSPIATVDKVDHTTTITITDKNGTTTAEVYDGSGDEAVTDVTVDGVSVVDDGVAVLTSPTIPTSLSDLTNDMDVSDFPNDAGYLTSFTETDPTVPSWAKASSKPSYTFSEIGTTPTTISGYGITDAYTKTEVDGLVSGVLHYKGTKATTSNLPSSGNVTGDTWHVTADGSEWAWDGTQWQELGTAVDLSGYVPTSRTVNGKALTGNITLSASDVSALPSSTTIPTITDTYSGTSSNGMSGKAVKSAIDALDGSVTGSAGSGKTLTAFSQTDGKVTATFGNISITKSQVSDFPTIPTVNNATLTIQKNGTTVNTFTANASSNVTANITVPTTAADVSAIPTSDKGANNGVCPLNASGKIDATYLPVYNGAVS